MRLILVGCEYSGTTTQSEAISEWAKEVMGGGFGFHDHWKVPHVSHPPGLTAEEQEQFLALSPNLKEMFQRYHMEYHLSPSFYGDPHHNSVGFHIDEAVYAPLYYGYGGAGEYGDRVRTARRTEAHIMEVAPDTVLVLVKASPDVIRRRMAENPHERGLVKDEDVERVLEAFQEQYDNSFIRKKFDIDTSEATVEESLSDFLEKLQPHLTDTDRLWIMSGKAMR
jgi:hypothetical protein